MPRRRQHEEHTSHEAWAIPYGDLITLLLAFFVVMYAMSSLNEGKYRVLSSALNAEFRGPQRSTQPIQVGEPQRGADSGSSVIEKAALLEGAKGQLVPPVDNPLPIDKRTATEDSHADPSKKPLNEKPGEKPNDKTNPPPTTPAEDVAGNAQELNNVADDVERTMNTLIREKLVTVRRHGLWIEVEIQSDILFPSGVAALSPLATTVLMPLADAMKPFPNPIRVEGHTDNVPINKREFPSNWELSAARAASVVHLFSNRGVAPARLTVIGLGEFRPIKSNTTAEGRSANRRVVLVILGSDGLPAGIYGHQSNTDDGNKDTKPALPVKRSE